MKTLIENLLVMAFLTGSGYFIMWMLLDMFLAQQEVAMVTLYKVTYMVQADESGIIYTTTTTWEELDRMLDDTEIIVFGYIKQEVII